MYGSHQLPSTDWISQAPLSFKIPQSFLQYEQDADTIVHTRVVEALPVSVQLD